MHSSALATAVAVVRLAAAAVARGGVRGLTGIAAAVPPPPPPPRPAYASVAPLAEAGVASGARWGGGLGSGADIVGLRHIVAMLAASTNTVVITGAGISTASGLADYRSPGRPPYKPLQHAEFVGSEAVRRRYWARSFVGWHRMQHVAPNAGHLAVAALAHAGLVSHIITQNVDRLHQRAAAAVTAAASTLPMPVPASAARFGRHGGDATGVGRDAAPVAAMEPPTSGGVLELHGTVHEVECMRCSATSTRAQLQDAMAVMNGPWLAHYSAVSSLRPDGDVELPPESYASFAVPACEACGEAALKPRVVFHGGTIAREVNEAALATVARSHAVLVLGSTCTTWSAFRLVRHVSTAGRPVALINYGPTRIDDYAKGRRVAQAHLSDALCEIADRLGVAVPSVSMA